MSSLTSVSLIYFIVFLTNLRAFIKNDNPNYTMHKTGSLNLALRLKTPVCIYGLEFKSIS